MKAKRQYKVMYLYDAKHFAFTVMTFHELHAVLHLFLFSKCIIEMWHCLICIYIKLSSQERWL